jgi:alpha-galactosidase
MNDKTTIESKMGNGVDDPFFIVRRVDRGEHYIGNLAWSANWQMTFERKKEGMCFTVGPIAENVLRVLMPGETVTSPVMHLGMVEEGFDAAVQAMHDHIRRTVVPPYNPKHAHRIQVSDPRDQGYHTGDDFNKAGIRQSVDVAAAIGAELFIGQI